MTNPFIFGAKHIILILLTYIAVHFSDEYAKIDSKDLKKYIIYWGEKPLSSRKNYFNITFWKVLAMVVVLLFADAVLKYSSGLGQNNSAEKIITEFASNNGFTLDDYPMEIREMLVQNNETKQFVTNYPKKITNYKPEKLDFSEYANCTEPPHLIQWDMRWGYMTYSGNVFGLTGSAPTCLSMVSIYVLQDTGMTPVHIAEFAKGTFFETDPEKLLSIGARKLGMNSVEVPRNNQRMREAVMEKGCSVICMLKSQELSQFVVITKIDDDGNFVIKDPSSKNRSKNGYSFTDLKNNGLKRVWKYSRATDTTYTDFSASSQ